MSAGEALKACVCVNTVKEACLGRRQASVENSGAKYQMPSMQEPQRKDKRRKTELRLLCLCCTLFKIIFISSMFSSYQYGIINGARFYALDLECTSRDPQSFAIQSYQKLTQQRDYSIKVI